MNDKSILDIIRVAIMYIGSLLGMLFDQIDNITWALIAFVTVDYITGIVYAFCSQTLSSKTGAKGIAKKLAILCVVAVSSALGNFVLGSDSLRTAVTFYYISNEGLSIIENCVKLGVPVPSVLKNALGNMSSSSERKAN